MKWLIWSREHAGWWKPGEYGYTRHISEAGLFSIERATEICVRGNYVTDRTGGPPEETIHPAPEHTT